MSQTHVCDTISGRHSKKLNHIRSLISNATANRTILHLAGIYPYYIEADLIHVVRILGGRQNWRALLEVIDA